MLDSKMLSPKQHLIAGRSEVGEIKATQVAQALESSTRLNSGLSDVKAEVWDALSQHQISDMESIIRARTPPNNRETSIWRWETAVSQYFGINVNFITSEIGGKVRYDTYIHWRLMGMKVLNGRISNSWPFWCIPLFRPCFRVQNIVAETSEIVRACVDNNVSAMNELFASGRGHANDTREDGLTLLYVGSS